MFSFKTCALAVLGAAASATLASGADLDPVLADAPEIAAEIGSVSGFYVRGDLAYEFESDLDGRLTIKGAGGSSETRGIDGTLGDGLAVSGGVGYQFTDMVRGDATLGYWRHGFDAGGEGCDDPFSCRWEESGDLEALELTANGYLDIGTVMGVTPYVGGGLGAVHLSYDDLDMSSGGTDRVLEGENSWRFAFALDAGVTYAVTDAMSLDVGYRYLDVDDGKAYKGADESFAGLQGSVRDDGFERHRIRLGLRYSFR